ncbi:hypothetical protein PLICRDRAFT_180655 [Plicaturopsis crispa FD-325 SS-3]|uniref:Uncharacterized protein n=1 Tax=Plicaturopsis crispa FD-325 SS-3 TaxID=944288 RepID=A0A0C9SVN8_PLICR|nr:hypothetical protein PLICRDRAFT_180655 [Plicaturopsis crispa FD-325 SS-3]
MAIAFNSQPLRINTTVVYEIDGRRVSQDSQHGNHDEENAWQITLDGPWVKEDGAVFTVINTNSPVFCPAEIWDNVPDDEETYRPLAQPKNPIRLGTTYGSTTGAFFFRIHKYPSFSLFNIVEVPISKWAPGVAATDAKLRVDWRWFADAEL